LRQASWASFNQAERQFQLGEWPEAVALLARAIKFDPANQVATERFFHELIVHREKALPPLIASFDHQDMVYSAAFSLDGARIFDRKLGQNRQALGCGLGQPYCLVCPSG
jgi:hypothetical protein